MAAITDNTRKELQASTMIPVVGQIRRLLDSSSQSQRSYYIDMIKSLSGFAGSFGAAFVHAVIIILRFILRRESHRLYPSTASASRGNSAVHMSVQKYKARSSSSSSDTGIDTTSYESQRCAICLGEFVNGECVSVLRRCKHIFHSDCIKQWMPVKSVHCPLCRAPAVDRDAPPAKMIGDEIPPILALMLALNLSSSETMIDEGILFHMVTCM